MVARQPSRQGFYSVLVSSSGRPSITVESPAGEGTVYVTVTTPGGTSPATGKEAKHAKFKYKKAKDKG